MKRGVRTTVALLALLLVGGGYSYWALHRALPELTPTLAATQLTAPVTASKLVWPASQAAVGVVGSNILQSNGKQTPLPTASTAKIITALMVLRAKPLSLGQQGPTITLTVNDVALYNSYVAGHGSVVPVQAGEQISEYQMLEAMLLPSANNMADSLATWAYGSLPAYTAAANAYLYQLGLTGTHIGSDASGFAPTSSSTAHDLVKLGELAMQNPVLAQIVGQSTASGIPVATTVKNVNYLLGSHNIVGVKTGNTDQAGGVYVSASKATVNQKPVTIVTAVIGAPTLSAAMQGSLPLIDSSQTNFQTITLVRAGATLGSYKLPWGGSVSAVASSNLAPTVWGGSSPGSVQVNLNQITTSKAANQPVGTLTTQSSNLLNHPSVPIKLQTPITKPTAWWRLLHPF